MITTFTFPWKHYLDIFVSVNKNVIKQSTFLLLLNLKQVPFYYQNKNVLEIDNLLKEAQRKFTTLNIYHGIAVCSYARAFFLYHKRFMFENARGSGKQDEHKIITEASMACVDCLPRGPTRNGRWSNPRPNHAPSAGVLCKLQYNPDHGPVMGPVG